MEVKAAIDTGAEMVRFKVYRSEGDGVSARPRGDRVPVAVEVPVLKYVTYYSSMNESQRRPVIKTKIKLGHKEWFIKVSLTYRKGKSYRMLLGFEALHGNFLVDCSQSFIYPQI